jgi:hypothetical protein
MALWCRRTDARKARVGPDDQATSLTIPQSFYSVRGRAAMVLGSVGVAIAPAGLGRADEPAFPAEARVRHRPHWPGPRRPTSLGRILTAL